MRRHRANRLGVEEVTRDGPNGDAVGLKGAEYWRTHAQQRPDMFAALDVPSNAVWYGALRIDMMKFHFSAAAVHTLNSRDAPSPAKAVVRAIEAVYVIPLPPLASDVGTVRLPVINVGMLGGGTVTNARRGSRWIFVRWIHDHQLEENAVASLRNRRRARGACSTAASRRWGEDPPQ